MCIYGVEDGCERREVLYLYERHGRGFVYTVFVLVFWFVLFWLSLPGVLYNLWYDGRRTFNRRMGGHQLSGCPEAWKEEL